MDITTGKPFGRYEWPSPEDLAERIDRYFMAQDTLEAPYTITGLARYLRMSVYELRKYQERPGYGELVEEAIATVVEKVEESLLRSRGPTGLMFWLKNNAGWTDQQEIKHGVSDSLTEFLDSLPNTLGPPSERTLKDKGHLELLESTPTDGPMQ